MDNSLPSSAPACASLLPHAFTLNEIADHLPKETIQFAARPLFRGTFFSLTITEAEVRFEPPGEELRWHQSGDFYLSLIAGIRDVLASFTCDAVRVEGRLLKLSPSHSRWFPDFFRMTLLRNETMCWQRVMPSNLLWSGNDDLIVHRVAMSTDDAQEMLRHVAEASGVIPAEVRSLSPRLEDEIDAVLWVPEGSADVPSILVPLALAQPQLSEHFYGDCSSCGSSVETPCGICLSLPKSVSESPPTTLLSASRRSLPPLDLRPGSSSPAKHLSFETLIPLLQEEEIAYVSHPVFQGADVSITVTADAISHFSGLTDAEDIGWFSAECQEASDRLHEFRERVTRATGGNAIRLNGRFVRLRPEHPGYIDIHQTVVIDDQTPLIECPYQEQIFENDTARVPRFVTWLSANTALEAIAVVQDATCALIRSDVLDDDQPARFEGMLWLPVARDKFRPSFFIPYDPSHLSEDEAWAWISKIHRRGFRNIFYVDGLEEIRWP